MATMGASQPWRFSPYRRAPRKHEVVDGPRPRGHGRVGTVACPTPAWADSYLGRGRGRVGTFLLGFVLGSYFVSADVGDDPDSHLDSYRFVVTAVAGVGGLALGFLQWPTVRGRSRRAYLLVVVNAIGWAVGWSIGPIVGTVMGHNSMIALLCSWIITIAFTGSGAAWLLSQRE